MTKTNKTISIIKKVKMAKDLIEVPDFNPDTLFYLIEVGEYKYFHEIVGYVEHEYNGRFYKREKYGYVPRKYRSSSTPITLPYPTYTKEYGYWSKFIFKTKRDDPLKPLWKIRKKYPKLLYKKFIFKRQEQFPPKIPWSGNKIGIKPTIRGKKSKPNNDYNNYDEGYYKVKYLEINESLLTYLRNKVRKEDIKLVNELQELFVRSSTNLSFVEFIKSKAKFLSELDLSNYIDELNEQTNKKLTIKQSPTIKIN